jgi:hypothetical protein
MFSWWAGQMWARTASSMSRPARRRAVTASPLYSVVQVAAVSRSWLYAQPDIRAEIERLRTASRRAPATQIPARQRASDASLRRRLEAATQRNRTLAEENRQLREQLARALGQARTPGHRTGTSGR